MMWEPIEDLDWALRDAEFPFLAYFPDGEMPHVIRWDEEYADFVFASSGIKIALYHWGDPTHWMPLPEPPK